MRDALGFAPAYDAAPCQRPAQLGHDRALVLAIAPVDVDHDPVVRASDAMGRRGIGVERGVVAIAACRVEDRKPALVHRVEPARRDDREIISSGSFAILAVDVQNLVDRRERLVRNVRTPRAQTRGQCVTNAVEPFRAEPWNQRQPPVVHGELELLERLDAKAIVNALGEDAAHAWYGGDESNRIGFPAKPLERR